MQICGLKTNSNYEFSESVDPRAKGRLRATVLFSADLTHLTASPKKHNNVRCKVSADSKMAAQKRPLPITYEYKLKN